MNSHQQYCSFQEVKLVRISVRKGNFWHCQNIKLILLSGPQTPRLFGGLQPPEPSTFLISPPT